jgi:hypothetical protein
LRVAGERLRRKARSGVVQARRRSRSGVVRAVRMTGAAVVSYLVALAIFPHTQPLLAALTALLVVQVTLFSMVTSGIQRVISVIAGVMVAVGVSSVVGLTWWSLAAVIAASIMIGQLLRLGPNMIEVPISAMLILGVGGADAAATDRIAETLVGAVIGVLVNVVFPPRVQAQQAGAAIERLAAEIAELLDRAAAELAQGVSVDEAQRWLEDARRLNRHVPRLDRALVRAQESRRLNMRALGTPDTGRELRDALDALEHCSVAVRSMFRSILDGVREWPEADDGYASDVRLVFAELLHELAAAVRSFGELARAEIDAPGELSEQAQLAAALDALREARARVTELLLVDPRDEPQLWELNGAILATVQRILSELDVEEHARVRLGRQREDADRPRAVQAVDRIFLTTRQLVPRTWRNGDVPTDDDESLEP